MVWDSFIKRMVQSWVPSLDNVMNESLEVREQLLHTIPMLVGGKVWNS